MLTVISVKNSTYEDYGTFNVIATSIVQPLEQKQIGC
jgi:hypothetical protein